MQVYGKHKAKTYSRFTVKRRESKDINRENNQLTKEGSKRGRKRKMTKQYKTIR